MGENKKEKEQGPKFKVLEEQQQKIMQLQVLQSYYQTAQQQAQQVAQKIYELQQSRQALEDFEKVKPSEALIPVGGGSYIFGKVGESDQVLVTFGAGVAVKKSGADALKLTESRIAELQKLLQEISMQQSIIASKMQQLQGGLRASENS